MGRDCTGLIHSLHNCSAHQSGHVWIRCEGDVQGKGVMRAVKFVQDKVTKQEFPPQEAIGPRLHTEAKARGLFTRLRGDVFLLAPPYVTTDQQLDRIVEILHEAT